MKKYDVYRLRRIFEELSVNMHNDQNNDMQKDKAGRLVREGMQICNQALYAMAPLSPKEAALIQEWSTKIQPGK